MPYAAYVDEVIYFTEKANLVNSFKTKFDDVWTSNTGMLANYANVTTIERAYPTTPDRPAAQFSTVRQLPRSVRRRISATSRSVSTPSSIALPIARTPIR